MAKVPCLYMMSGGVTDPTFLYINRYYYNEALDQFSAPETWENGRIDNPTDTWGYPDPRKPSQSPAFRAFPRMDDNGVVMDWQNTGFYTIVASWKHRAAYGDMYAIDTGFASFTEMITPSPQLYSGKYYILNFRYGTGTDKWLSAYKSADFQTWTAIDSTAQFDPASGTNNTTGISVFSKNVFYIPYKSDGSNTWQIMAFDCTTETWSTGSATFSEASIISQEMYLLRRSDDSFVLVYSSTSSGTRHPYYRTLDSINGTWSSATQVDSATTGDTAVADSILEDNDAVHISYIWTDAFGNPRSSYRRLSAANSLSSEVNFAITGDVINYGCTLIYNGKLYLFQDTATGGFFASYHVSTDLTPNVVGDFTFKQVTVDGVSAIPDGYMLAAFLAEPNCACPVTTAAKYGLIV